LPQEIRNLVERTLRLGFFLVGTRFDDDVERCLAVAAMGCRVGASVQQHANDISVPEGGGAKKSCLSVERRQIGDARARLKRALDAGAIAVPRGAEQPLVLVAEWRVLNREDKVRHAERSDETPQDFAGAVVTE